MEVSKSVVCVCVRLMIVNSVEGCINKSQKGCHNAKQNVLRTKGRILCFQRPFEGEETTGPGGAT